MEHFYKNLSTVVFYTCGTCNLNCRYCGINKNPILKDIDNVLAKSFEGDYYFQRVKDYFPRKDMLLNFETWGGEPFLHMERLYPVLRTLLNYYPYLQNGYSSTNFSFENWNEKFFGLMDCFGQYPNRLFKYCLQLSVDGPEYINDAGRGEGVTEKCLTNFNKLVALLAAGRLPKNVELTITLKGTLDNDTIKQLCQKDKIIEYFQFYENNFIKPIKQLNLSNVDIIPTIPNTAVPSPVTKEDGKTFAKLVKLCREIEEENKTCNYFDYYNIITPYYSNICQNCLTYKYGWHTCGTGDSVIGLLPDNMVSTCHEGFTQIVEEYQKLAAQDKNLNSTITFDKFRDEQAISLCVDDEGFYEHHCKMSLYQHDDATARVATSAGLIVALALAKQIDECYINQTNALKAAIFIQSHTSYCIKDNYNKTGSYTLPPVGLYKLLLNGAMEYIQGEGELKVNDVRRD